MLHLSLAQVEVDDNARILRERSDRPKGAQAHPAAAKQAEKPDSRPETSCGSSDIVIPSLYATGLGFGLPAVYGAVLVHVRASASRLERASFLFSRADDGDFDGTTGRADGVAVYLKHAAATILEALFGAERIYGEGFTSWSDKQLSYTAKATSAIKSPTAEAQMGTMHRLCNARRDATQAMPPHVDFTPVSPAAPISPVRLPNYQAACRAVSPIRRPPPLMAAMAQ